MSPKLLSRRFDNDLRSRIDIQLVFVVDKLKSFRLFKSYSIFIVVMVVCHLQEDRSFVVDSQQEISSFFAAKSPHKRKNKKHN